MGIIAVALAAVVGLSACGEIEVDSPNGQGDCGGNPVTLVTSQNASGDTLTIDYTGPNTVGLFYSTGFYWNDLSTVDPSLYGDYMWGWGSNSHDLDLLRLDTSAPGWTVTGSGVSWHYSFTGSIQTLLNSQTFITLPPSQLAVLPNVIAVDCDVTHTSSRTVTATIPGGLDNIVAGFSFAVAQPLTPNTLAMDPLEVVTSHTTSTGATATLRYSSAGLDRFGSFTPDTPGSISVYQAFPGLATDNLHDLYLHGILHHNSGEMLITSTNPDGSFNVTIDDGSGGLLADGDYLVFLQIPNVTNDAFRMVFAEFVYDHAGGGIIFRNPFAHLAQTGTPSELPVAAGLTAGGLAVVGGALLFIARRRRRHVG